MNNPLMPEQRVNKLGHTVTKHVRAYFNTGTGPDTSRIPAPNTGNGGPGEPSRQHQQSLLEKLLDGLVDFLMGGPGHEQEAEAERQARELLRQRLSELPARTLQGVSDTWERLVANAERKLDQTEFGDFSKRLRAGIVAFTEYEPGDDAGRERVARESEDFVEAVRTGVPPFPDHDPTIHIQYGTVFQPEDLGYEPEHAPLRPDHSQPEDTPIPGYDFTEPDESSDPRSGPSAVDTLDEMMTNARSRRGNRQSSPVEVELDKALGGRLDDEFESFLTGNAS